MDETDLLPEEAEPAEPSPLERTMLLAQTEGDISHAISEDQLAKIGADVVKDYELDLADPDYVEWREKAEAAIDSAGQKKPEAKNYPWTGAANVRYPMLTVAALQYNARAYPAIVKGDEAVSIKIVGKDNGRPQMGADGQPQLDVAASQQMGQPVPVWRVQPGAKKQRASRVKDYLNTYLFYRMEGWEADTDQLTYVLPIVGCAFRKVSWQDGRCVSRLVSALKLVAPMNARDCETAPRLTEEIDDLFGYQVADRMASGFYRKIDLMQNSEDEEKCPLLLEQHRRMDLDGDGITEPYIVTVDKESSQVLRIESNFGKEQAMRSASSVKKLSTYYVKFNFFPHAKGLFYGIGFGHLLENITGIVDSMLNQLIDAGTAQTAGGGFVASGVRLQGKGSSAMSFEPGKYKTVNGVTGAQLKDAIWERTFPNPSPVTFQLLDLMLAASRDITSVKDVVTGEASNNGQVGTTLALIEQSLQMFTASYKRIFLGLKEEFGQIFDCIGRWGGEEAQRDYVEVLDDDAADLHADFATEDMDIRPVSDPTSVTKTQKLNRAQFMGQFLGKGLNDVVIMKRMLEAADVEDVDELLPQGPPQPDPGAMAKAHKDEATAVKTEVETAQLAHGFGAQIGAMNGADTGGVPGMAGQPGQPMGVQGDSAGM
jgi:chaperonin GroES